MSRPALPQPRWLRAGRVLGFAALARRVHARHPLIVMYHGVAEDPLPHGKFTANAVFRADLDAIERHFQVVGLEAIAGWMAGGDPLPARALALTFDDAYSNLLETALPELHRRGHPSTVFVCSVGLRGPDELLWFDEVECRVLHGADLPERLEVGERVFHPVAARDRTALLAELRRHLKSVPQAVRDAAIQVLRRCSVEQASRDPYRAFDAGDVRRARALGASIGGHTAHHAILGRELPEVQEREVSGNAVDLTEACGGTAPTLFAYPNGRSDDVTDASRRAVARSGYRLAVTTEEGFVRRSTDPYLLPRISARFFRRYGLADGLAGLHLRVSVSERRNP